MLDRNKWRPLEFFHTFFSRKEWNIHAKIASSFQICIVLLTCLGRWLTVWSALCHTDGNCVFKIYFLCPLLRQEHWAATCLCKRPVAFRLAGEHWVIMGGSCFLVSSRSCSMDKRSGKSEGMEIPNLSSKKGIATSSPLRTCRIRGQAKVKFRMYRTNISVNSQRWHLSQEIALNSSLKFLKLHFPRRGAIIALIAFLFPAPGPLPAPLLPPAKSNLNEGLSHNYIATFSLLFCICWGHLAQFFVARKICMDGGRW